MSIFFSHPSLISERWRQAFPNAIITEAPVEDTIISQHTLYWVVTNLPDWEQRVQRLARQGATVVTLSSKESRTELLAVLAAGGRGYVHALANAATLVAVAASVINGGLWLGSDFVSDLIKGINSIKSDLASDATPASAGVSVPNAHGTAQPAPELDKLTAREREVCMLVANAHSNKEVARLLNVTERTVKAHLGAAFEKLQVRDRMQLTLLINGMDRSVPEMPPRAQNGW